MDNKLQIILNKLNDIKYGYVDDNKNIYPDDIDDWDINFSKLYHLQSPLELINNKYGVCWDQVELERYYLEKDNIDSKSYFIIAYDNKIEPTHTFIVIKSGNYYWFEHSWEPYRGVHEYKTLNELLTDVKNKFESYIKSQNINNYKISIYQYDKPKYGLNCINFINHCESGKKINI